MQRAMPDHVSKGFDLFDPPVPAPVLVGCAGWNVPSAVQDAFQPGDSHLMRYASVFPAVEINTSFYRPHRRATYARWRDSVPEGFRFSAKVPKAITHGAKLQDVDEALDKFIGEVHCLEQKLGCLLVQLPPSLRFDAAIAGQFFRALRSMTNTAIACEPRHVTWFGEEAAAMLAAHNVGYVDADPPVAAIPRRHDEAPLAYIRLHGSPTIYHSPYSEDFLDALAMRLAEEQRQGRQAWCVFDNTASGAAVPNGLALLARLQQLALDGMPAPPALAAAQAQAHSHYSPRS